MTNEEMLATVCSIETETNSREMYAGHGVFISPWHVLTAWHVIAGAKDINFISRNGEIARMSRGSPHNKRDVANDLAIVALDNPISDDFAKVSTGDLGVETIHGAVATLWQGKPACHTMRLHYIDLLSSFAGKARPPNYICEVELHPGHSGSPVFNDKGEIISLVSAKSDDDILFAKKLNTHFGHEKSRGLPFIAASPQATAKIYRSAFSIA